VIPGDVWPISHLQQKDPERTGYPTQKPRALLKRIINASCPVDGWVLDPFCGCGTTALASQELGRNWVGIDISPTAIKIVEQQLRKLYRVDPDKDYIVTGMPKTVAALRKLKPFEFQNWVNNKLGARGRRPTSDKGIDGEIPQTLWHQKAGIQVKQSDAVGRPVVDAFETALPRAGCKLGYIVAFSFSKGAYEEIALAKKRSGIDIMLERVPRLVEIPSGSHITLDDSLCCVNLFR